MDPKSTVTTDTIIKATDPWKWCKIIKSNISDPVMKSWLASVIYWRWCEKNDVDCTGLTELMDAYPDGNPRPMKELKEALTLIGIEADISKWFTRQEENRRKKGAAA